VVSRNTALHVFQASHFEFKICMYINENKWHATRHGFANVLLLVLLREKNAIQILLLQNIVSFIGLFLQKRPIILRSLLVAKETFSWHEKNAIQIFIFVNATAHMPCSEKCSNIDISQSANRYLNETNSTHEWMSKGKDAYI